MNEKQVKKLRKSVKRIEPPRKYKEIEYIEYIYGYKHTGDYEDDGITEILIPKKAKKVAPIKLDYCRRLALKQLKKKHRKG